jgi:hypothetical protein
VRLKKEAEREEEWRRFEAERLEKEAEREENKRLFHADVEMKMKEQEIELMKLKIALIPHLAPVWGQDGQNSKSKDDIDAYIERFERFSISQGWKEETWAMSLSSLLTGKGLEVYTSVSPEQSTDYQYLKQQFWKDANEQKTVSEINLERVNRNKGSL